VTSHDDIRQLMQRYARTVDDRDIGGLASLFHPDARIAGTRAEQSLEEWLETMRAPRSFPSSMHFLGEPLIAEDGSGQAEVDTYAVVYHLTLGMRYRDQVVLEQGRWVFKRRSSIVVWMR
jgi:hypothetical protein